MQRHTFELFSYWRSSCSWRLRWGLEYKNLKYKITPINLLTGEHKQQKYLKLNPRGYLPCLLIDGVSYSESLALLEWLEENYPQPPLLPTNSLDRLKTRQITQMIASGIQPVQNLNVLKSVSSDVTTQKSFARHHIERGLEAVEQVIRETAGTYTMGSTLTLADLALIPQVYNALRFGIPIERYPTINGIYKHVRMSESCEKSSPEKQPDAQKTP